MIQSKQEVAANYLSYPPRGLGIGRVVLVLSNDDEEEKLEVRHVANDHKDSLSGTRDIDICNDE